MKKSLIALALLAATSAFALDIGAGVAGATGTSATGGSAAAGGQQSSALFGVSGGTQTAASTGISGNLTSVNSTGGTTVSEHQDAAGATQTGGSLGFAQQSGSSVAGSTSTASGSFGLLKGFVFINP
jgi:hypothetical protein